MKLAEVIQEGERLEKELAAENARKKPDWHLVSDLTARVFHIYKHHGPALLAVAKAAVEWDRAATDSYRASEAANRALRAAVRGDAEGEKK